MDFFLLKSIEDLFDDNDTVAVFEDSTVKSVANVASRKRKSNLFQSSPKKYKANEIVNDKTDETNKNLLSNYVRFYSKIFPYEDFFKVFGNRRREFAMNLKTKSQYIFKENQKFIRHINFFSPGAMKKFVLQNLPDDLYIGGFNASKLSMIKAELKFDFDIDLYDEVRNCCQNNAKCNSCFKFLKAAYIILTVNK